MKFAVISILVLGLVNGVAAAAESESGGQTTTSATPIASDTDKALYTLGYELGKELSRQDLELVQDVLLRAVEDGMSGNKPLVDAKERQAALKQMRENRAAANLEAARAFLAANAKKQGVKELPSGLQFRELRAGEGKTPTANDTVRVHYRGTLVDGTEFDSSHKRGKPATFRVNNVIKGWQEGLLMMKEGAKWELFIPPELAYGERGRSKAIPPNSALIFEVELIAVK